MIARSRRWSPPDERLVATAVAAAAFLVAWGLVHRWFWAHGQIGDWPTDRTDGEAIRHGQAPYRDFAVEYPPGVEKTFPFTDTPIPVYEKEAVIVLHFVDEPHDRVTVSIVYQACDDSACLPPVCKAATFEV